MGVRPLKVIYLIGLMCGPRSLPLSLLHTHTQELLLSSP